MGNGHRPIGDIGMVQDITLNGEVLRHTPRSNPHLIGHAKAQAQILDAFNAGRLHHAWLITGPRGIGKATLAYRFARFLLAHPPLAEAGLFGDVFEEKPTNLDLRADDPLFHRITSGGHADLISVERGVDEKSKKLRGEIVVDDVRELSQFFSKTAGEGGWRVAIVDAADEMNRNAANALLKVLEEPPANAILLLVCHTPGRLLPTILSRCRKLKLQPLENYEVSAILGQQFPDLPEAERQAIVRISHGSPGRAVKLAELNGLEVQRDLLALLSDLPKLDTRRLYQFADKLAGREAEASFSLFGELLEDFISAAVQLKTAGLAKYELEPGEEEVFQKAASRIGLDRWFELWEKTSDLMASAQGVNLDRKQLVLNIFHLLETAAQN
jgi:DNA polymerase-3 subunit delta'